MGFVQKYLTFHKDYSISEEEQSKLRRETEKIDGYNSCFTGNIVDRFGCRIYCYDRGVYYTYNKENCREIWNTFEKLSKTTTEEIVCAIPAFLSTVLYSDYYKNGIRKLIGVYRLNNSIWYKLPKSTLKEDECLIIKSFTSNVILLVHHRTENKCRFLINLSL